MATSHPEDSSQQQGKRLRRWLWKGLCFVWSTLLLGFAVNLIANAISLESLLSWMRQYPLPLAGSGSLLLLLTVIVWWSIHQEHRLVSDSSRTPLLRSRQLLLQRVRVFWIDGVLEQSLHNAVLLALDLHERPDALANLWHFALQRSRQVAGPLPPDTRITQVYKDISCELLILGEPGSGKTTLLLELARDLLAEAQHDESHPLPVVFNLSSWAIKRQPLAEWLIEELNIRYQVPRKLAQEWVSTEQLLPLLDGLDEVASTYRPACVAAINTYRQQHGMVPLVVCCRSGEYLSQPSRILLDTAIEVQPLTSEQIDAYLLQGGLQLEGIRQALHQDARLQELARSPLMLSVLTLAYRGKSADYFQGEGSFTEQRQAVFTTYIHRMLYEHRGPHDRYTEQQTRHWLAWLAKQLQQHNQTEFRFERMQFDWLEESSTRRFYPGAGLGLVYGLLTGAIFGLFNWLTTGPRLGAVTGVAVGCLNGFLYLLLNGLIPGDLDLLYGLIFALLNAMLLGLLFQPIFGFLWGTIYGSLYGFVIAFIYGLLGRPDAEIQPAEMVMWSWRGIRQNAIKFLGTALLLGLSAELVYQQGIRLATGLALGIIFGLMGGLESGLVDQSTLATPNQGILRSARNSVLSGGITALISGSTVGLFSGFAFGPLDGIVYGLAVGLTLGIFVCLRNGGTACLQHLILRFLLWDEGRIPWHYIHFLDYAAERILLRKVGGGYIFIHRMLLEYFAAMDMTEVSPQQEGTSVHAASPPFLVRRSSRRAVLAGIAGLGLIVTVGSTLWWLYRGLIHVLCVYRGHSDSVTSVTWSPDSMRIASGSYDHTVQVWDATNANPLYTYRGHNKNVISVAWSPDGTRIASGSDDTTVQVWDAANGNPLYTYRGHTDHVHSVAWSPDGTRIASGSNDHTVQVWNAEDGSHALIYHDPTWVWTVAWSPDGTRIASGSSDSTVKVWNAQNGSLLLTYGQQTSKISTVAWSHDSTRIASGSDDITVHVFDAQNGATLMTYQTPDKVRAVAWSPDSTRIVSGSTDGTTQVWNTQNGSQMLIYKGFPSTAVAWSPDGKYIASGGTDRAVKVWKPA